MYWLFQLFKHFNCPLMLPIMIVAVINGSSFVNVLLDFYCLLVDPKTRSTINKSIYMAIKQLRLCCDKTFGVFAWSESVWSVRSELGILMASLIAAKVNCLHTFEMLIKKLIKVLSIYICTGPKGERFLYLWHIIIIDLKCYYCLIRA